MKLIILAAGTGSRLMPLTKDLPKSLIDLGNGTTLLEEQLNKAMSNKDIEEVILVTGYLSEKIEQFLSQKKLNKPIHIEYNPFYDISNNLLSLWCVRHLLLEKDFAVSNGDNLYEKHFFDKAISQIQKEGIYVTINHKNEYDEDDMKVSLSDGAIKRIHKQIPKHEAKAESVGLIWVKGKANRTAFYNALTNLCKNPNNIKIFWLEVLNQLIQEGQKILPITMQQKEWFELDFHFDMNTIQQALATKLLQAKALS